MPLKIYNSLTSKKEIFQPISEKAVGMYVCGPTVYGEPHLGHARSAITFDVAFRYLNFLGYKVRYVRNITDVGHLEDEQNEAGEDKILKKARIEQLEPMEIAQHYTNLYRENMRALNVKDPSIEPQASGHIPEQIEIIEKIIENGLAYVVNGSVYFDVQAYAKRYAYGQLSGRTLDKLQPFGRKLNGSFEKRFHADFALWKKAGPEHIMRWKSPWGMGFPGWHIECTAMSIKYLGIPFDIHGGGMDLKFPHHESEICQALGAYGKQPVNYWMHNNMITLDGQKMAKSKNNFITLAEMFSGNHPMLAQAYAPMVVRFFILQAHYGSTLDFSNESLMSAENAFNKLENTYHKLHDLQSKETKAEDAAIAQEITEVCNRCYDAMNDDFNTAKLIAALFELSKIINAMAGKPEKVWISPKTKEKLIKTYHSFWREVMGMQRQDSSSAKFRQAIDILMDLRQDAKAEKNYAYSDFIRERLSDIGIQIRDGKDGRIEFIEM